MTNWMPKNKMLKSLQSFLVLKNFSFLISNSLFFQLATVHKNTKISISKNLTSRLPIRDSLFVPFSLTVVTRTNTKTVHKLLWLIYNRFCDTPLFLMSLSHFRILFAYELCLRLSKISQKFWKTNCRIFIFPYVDGECECVQVCHVTSLNARTPRLSMNKSQLLFWLLVSSI